MPDAMWYSAGVHPLEIIVSTEESGPVLKLSGESDLTTAAQLRDALATQISGGAQHLTVDLAELRFADSASIRELLEAHQALNDRGGTLELVRPQHAVAKSPSLLGLDRLLTIRPRAGNEATGQEPTTC